MTAADLAVSDPERARRWGKMAISIRLVLAALGQAAMVAGSPVIEFGVRNLSLYAGVSPRTVARVMELLREEDDPLIDLVSRYRMKRADRYQLVIPRRYAEACEWRRRRAGWVEAVHPVFAVLGGVAALCYTVLTADPMPAAQVARAARLGETATAGALRVLAEHGLAEHGRQGWLRGTAALDAVADKVGATDLHQDRIEQYKKEREIWQAIISSWLAPFPSPMIRDPGGGLSFDDLAPTDLEPPPWLVDDPGPPVTTAAHR